jgi:signal transduction histidine kinase
MDARQQTAAVARGPETPALVECIYRIGRLMEHVAEPPRLLRAILEECKGLMQCEAASLALVDAQRADLRFVVAAGGDEQGILDWRLPIGQGIVGAVAQSGEPLVVNDPKRDPRWFDGVDRQAGFVTRNLAAAPMRHEGILTGVVEVINHAGDAPFEDADLKLLQIFADQSGVAIQIQRLIAAKAESDRLAGFGIAMADIGHSTKNILQRLKAPMYVIDMAGEQGNWDLMREPWRIMKKATGEINDLVLDMLSYAKPRTPAPKPTDVGQLLREIADACRDDVTSKGIALSVECVIEPCEWTIDTTILRPVLMNLVGNAIEALAEHKPAGAELALGARAESDSLRLWVKDNGPGIPEAIRPNLFKPFFTHGKAKGTGLGLANVKKGVEEHGGRVELDTSEGRGTTFTLFLPRTMRS